MTNQIKTYLLATLTLIMFGCSTTQQNNSYEHENLREIKLSGQNNTSFSESNDFDWHFKIKNIKTLRTEELVYQSDFSEENTKINVKANKYIVTVDCFYKVENTLDELHRKTEKHTVNLKWIESASFHIGIIENTCSMRPLYNSIAI